MSTNSHTLLRSGEPDTLIGMTLAGRYRIKGILGEGGMGVVYSARHDAMDRDVAVKVMLPRSAADHVEVQRFLSEARIAGGLGHPNIVEVFDIGRLGDGRPFLVMPRLRGRGLDQLLETDKRLTPTQVGAIVRGVASALDVLHAQRIVHRDLKPQNLFLSRQADGTSVVKLLDFGLATLLGEHDVRLTRTDMIVGTPQYLPPEAGDGRMLDARGDVYAVACIVYQALTGHLPFEGSSAGEIMRRKMSLDPPLLAIHGTMYDLALEEALQRGLHYDPECRYQSAGAFADDVIAAITAQFGPVPRTVRMNEQGVPQSERPASLEVKTTPMQSVVRADLLRVFDPPVTTRTPVETPAATEHSTASSPRARPRVEAGPSQPGHQPPGDSDASHGSLPTSPSRWRRALAAACVVTALGAATVLMMQATTEGGTQDVEAPHRVRSTQTSEPTVATAEVSADEVTPVGVVGAASNTGPATPAPQEPPARPPSPAAPGRAGSASPSAPLAAAPSAEPRPAVPTTAIETEATIPIAAATAVVAANDDREPGAGLDHRASTLVSEGTRLLVAGQLPAAVDKFREATHSNPGNSAAWRGLGLGYQRMGRNPEARRAFERYLLLAPHARDADMIRARVINL